MKPKALFPSTTLKRIPVFDTPDKVDSLTPEEFQQKFGCEYTESIWAMDELAIVNDAAWNRDLENRNKLSPGQQKLLERLENPLENIAIGFINEKVGYGLFAQGAIPSGTIICIYSGVLGEGKTYSAGGEYQSPFFKNITVNAKEKGGVVRFMQHLPDEEELEDL